MLNALVGSIQRVVSRSRAGVTIAIKLKQQCDSIVGRRVGAGIDPEENGEGWIARTLAPHCANFVDVGANVGAWSIMFASQMTGVRTALLFEPSPATASRLQEAIQASGFAGLEIVRRAVGDTVSRATFHAEGDFGETSSLVSGHSQKGAETIEVDVSTLDKELAARNWTGVDFLKVDAEGFDLRVLQGSRTFLEQQKIKVVQFEYNHPWASAGSTLHGAFDLLEGHGYKVRLLKGEGLFALDPRQTGEYYRYSNFIAYRPGPMAELLEQRYQGNII